MKTLKNKRRNYGCSQPEVKGYEAEVIFCGWRYFCAPACVDVNGVDKCVNLLSIPLGGLDLIREVGPCEEP